MQREAGLLKGVAMTRVVTIGIGANVGRRELLTITSAPRELNVITAPEFNRLRLSATNNKQMELAVCGKHQPHCSHRLENLSAIDDRGQTDRISALTFDIDL